MSQNFDALHTPEAQALLKDPARLKALLQSPETRKLMSLLSSQNGDSLKQAAGQAKQGDLSGISSMVQKLMKTSEGAEAVENVIKRS